MTNYFNDEAIEFINADKITCPKYKEKPERSDPFALEQMQYNLDKSVYSQFLRSHIHSLQAACDHARYLVESWAKEDKSELRRAQNQRYHLKRKKIKLESYPELVKAKDDWQNAIRKRNDLIKEWDVYITKLHQEYLRVKINCTEGASE